MGEAGQEGGRVQRDRGAGRGKIGTLFPLIAADFSDVICHSKKHFCDQMFRLNEVEWVYSLLGDQYRSSAWRHSSLLDAYVDVFATLRLGLCKIKKKLYTEYISENHTLIICFSYLV